MTIRHLRIFKTVAECGKMGLAAEKLFISQPSVSQAIKEIEEHYDVKLFERLSKKLYITESGEKLLRYARHMLQSFDEMELQLRHTGKNVCVRIGATITVGSCLLQPIIKSFEEKYENIQNRVVVNNTNVIEQMLLKSQLDVGIIEGRIEHAELTQYILCKDRLVLAVGQEHVLYGHDKIKIEQLQGMGLLCREEGSGVRSLFHKVLEDHHIWMPIKWDCSNTEAIKNAAIGGQGIAVVSEKMIEEEVKKKKLHIIQLENIELSREISVVLHKDKFISDHLQCFLDYLKKQFS